MTERVLIANRGEIALRALRSFKRLGLETVAVYSDCDRNAPHAHEATLAVALGGDRPAESYLAIEKLIAACRTSGATLVFPGYGFLSESAAFAEACAGAGIAFMGPTPQQLRDFGLKHRARMLAAAAGVPVTPASGLLDSLDQALEAAADIGYPVMLKSTAGGGGIGLSRCADPAALRAAFESVRRLGLANFGDGGLFLERCIDNARHIEVQIFGDGLGRVAALGERDCSVQRRNQKMLEETPAPGLADRVRAGLHRAAVRLGQSVKYRSAGTVEFIYDTAAGSFHFLEVNARLQVEHPVTEMVFGVDLVEQMLRVARGQTPDWAALDRAPRGAAIEVRLYAEDPLKAFHPVPGILTEVHFPEPNPGLRIDGWVKTGTEISHHYDPMLAKLIVHGEDRAAARAALAAALAETRLFGLPTNLDHLRAIVAAPRFAAGAITTRFIEDLSVRPPVIEVLEPGTGTSVQDYPGRLGYWNVGVPPSGPMDDLAFRLGNRILGNPETAAGLECTLVGPTLRCHRETVVAVTGAALPVTLDGAAVPMWAPVTVAAGQVLALGKAGSGCRAYLAVRNGLDGPLVLGSRSTFALGQFGGHAGRLLRTGDMLPVADPALPASLTPAPAGPPRALPAELVPVYPRHWRIRVLEGPHGAPEYLTPESMAAFFAADWQVHHNSNRLGVRLVGPRPVWTRAHGGEAGLHPSNIHDCEYAIGSVNFTGDSPVILTCDGPSLGGFVCPVTVIRAELWKVGQVKPGDTIRFVAVDYEHAVALEREQNTLIRSFAAPPPPAAAAAATRGSAAILNARPAGGTLPKVEWRQAGDGCILMETGDDVMALSSRLRVHLLTLAIEAAGLPVEELSPGVRSLQIRYDSRRIRQPDLMRELIALEQALPDPANLKLPIRVLHLPMTFQDEATLGAIRRYRETIRATAPWLPDNAEFLRRANGLASIDEVRRIVFSARYMVLGLGDVFLGAPCSVPVDPRHRLLGSKYNPARSFTAEGTVGIGGMYMCLYGMDSPGGYQLIGRSLPIWNTFLKNRRFEAGKPWLLRFFDCVRFEEVDEATLTGMREAFREGWRDIRVDHEIFDFEAHQRFLADHAGDIAAFRSRQKAAFDAEIAEWSGESAAPETPPEPAPAAEIALGNGHAVSAEMHGSVWKIPVSPGQSVAAGETLVIIEAMKMELAVTAPVAGRLRTVLCQVGALVSTGDLLAIIDP
ncbi:MAG: urea carboxylase [Rhodospirillaceae bacterium]